MVIKGDAIRARAKNLKTEVGKISPQKRMVKGMLGIK